MAEMRHGATWASTAADAELSEDCQRRRGGYGCGCWVCSPPVLVGHERYRFGIIGAYQAFTLVTVWLRVLTRCYAIHAFTADTEPEDNQTQPH